MKIMNKERLEELGYSNFEFYPDRVVCDYCVGPDWNPEEVDKLEYVRAIVGKKGKQFLTEDRFFVNNQRVNPLYVPVKILREEIYG